jgi:UDP-galactopyranose mutase
MKKVIITGDVSTRDRLKMEGFIKAFSKISHVEYIEPNLRENIISKEFPEKWDSTKERYYPVNDEGNNIKYKQYKNMIESDSKYILGGRLAEYRYYDMNQVIGSAISKFSKFIKK